MGIQQDYFHEEEGSVIAFFDQKNQEIKKVYFGVAAELRDLGIYFGKIQEKKCSWSLCLVGGQVNRNFEMEYLVNFYLKSGVVVATSYVQIGFLNI